MEIYCKMTEIGKAIEVFTTTIKSTGILSKGTEGTILYNDEPLKPMDNLEILLDNDEFDIHGWTRVFVGLNENGQFLVGIPRDVDIDGIKARIRG